MKIATIGPNLTKNVFQVHAVDAAGDAVVRKTLPRAQLLPFFAKVLRVFAETINGLYKAEAIHRRGPWRSFEAVEHATLEWVGWCNDRRLLEPIGNIPPAEAA